MESDAEFVERMLADFETFGFDGLDIERMRSLARRGAAMDDVVEAAMDAIAHVRRFNSGERAAEARAMVRKAAGET